MIKAFMAAIAIAFLILAHIGAGAVASRLSRAPVLGAAPAGPGQSPARQSMRIYPLQAQADGAPGLAPTGENIEGAFKGPPPPAPPPVRQPSPPSPPSPAWKSFLPQMISATATADAGVFINHRFYAIGEELMIPRLPGIEKIKLLAAQGCRLVLLVNQESLPLNPCEIHKKDE